MHSKSFTLKLRHKINPFRKSIKVDSDKSLSIRSFLIGSISQNISLAKNARIKAESFDCNIVKNKWVEILK